MRTTAVFPSLRASPIIWLRSVGSIIGCGRPTVYSSSPRSSNSCASPAAAAGFFTPGIGTLDAPRQIGGGRRRAAPGDLLAAEGGFRRRAQLGRQRGVRGNLHVLDADETDREFLFALADAFK